MLIGALIHYPLGWGLMDDAGQLWSIQHEWARMSLLQVLRVEMAYVYRPVYTAYCYYLYRVFWGQPKLFYLFNFSLVAAGVLPWTLVLRRQASERFRAYVVPIFVFLVLSATPVYNLIVYLSLQEKFVVFFGGWAFYFLRRAEEEPSRWGLFQTAAWVSFVLGVSGKPTAISFVPAGIFTLMFASDQKGNRRLLPAMAWVGAALCFGFIFLKQRQGYTSRYAASSGALTQRLLGQNPVFYALALIGILTAALLLVKSSKLGELQKSRLAALIWPISLLSYLVVLLPWGLHSYLWSPAMVIGMGCLALSIDRILSFVSPESKAFQLAQAGMLASFICATFVVYTVGVARIARQAEIPAVVHWLSERLPATDTDVYTMEPCIEAASALTYLTGGHQVIPYLHRGDPTPSSHPKVWLITRDECPVDPAHKQEFSDVIFQLPHWTIYQRRNVS